MNDSDLNVVEPEPVWTEPSMRTNISYAVVTKSIRVTVCNRTGHVDVKYRPYLTALSGHGLPPSSVSYLTHAGVFRKITRGRGRGGKHRRSDSAPLNGISFFLSF